MSIVLDSSVVLAWIYAEETTDEIRRVFDTLIDSSAWVPSLWRLEVANVLEMGVRRNRHSADFRDSTLADLTLLPIQVDLETDRQAWDGILLCAERHQLTIYDAAYLELALRRKLPLATLDQQLRAAANAESITLLGI